MVKVTLIGAGSAVFARQIITDVLAIDGLDGGTFALVDIDADRLKLAHDISERLVEATGKDWAVESSTERNDVLAGTDFLVNSIEVAGLENVRHDYEIPLRYGIDQCIGDTIGPGGIFKALRTGPAWLEILRDAERECPGAVVMNYTNPISLLTLAATRATRHGRGRALPQHTGHLGAARWLPGSAAGGVALEGRWYQPQLLVRGAGERWGRSLPGVAQAGAGIV